MPIPPLILNQGHINTDGRKYIRNFLKQESETKARKERKEQASVRAVCSMKQHKTSPEANRTYQNPWTQWLAKEIQTGIEENHLSYDNDEYIFRAFRRVDKNFVEKRAEKRANNRPEAAKRA